MPELKNRYELKIILAAVFIIFLALTIRMVNLDSLPVFADEAIYVRWAQVMRVEPSLRFLPLSDGKQPLFMWAIIPFQKIISDPLIAGRMLSALSGIAGVVGVGVATYLLTKSRKASIVSSLIYAVMPFMVFFDRMALVDALLSALGVWFFVMMVVSVKTLRIDAAMTAGFLLGFAWLTKSPALFFVLLAPTVWLLADWPVKKLNKLLVRKNVIHFAKLFGLFAVTFAIGGGLYNILRLGPEFHMLGIRNKDYIWPLASILTTPLDPFLPHFDRVIEYFWLLGPWLFLPLLLVGVYMGFKNRLAKTLVLSTWGVGPITAVSAFTKVMTARYILFTIPFLIILIGLTFADAKMKQPKKQALMFGLILLVIHSLWIDWNLVTAAERVNLPRSERSGYLEEWTAGTGIKKASLIIREEYLSDPDTKIVVGTEGFFGTLPDALQAYLNDLPEITVIGVGLGIEEVPIPLVESRDSGNKTYLLINGTRLSGNPDEMGLLLVEDYPKAVQPDGSREILQLYEVQ